MIPTPTPTPRMDYPPSRDTLAELCNCVRDRTCHAVLDLHLIVRDGGLVLTGRADSYYAKQLAQHALLEASSYPLRANEIVVG